MSLKYIKVQVLFTEDSVPRVVNAELTANGIQVLEKLQDDFSIEFADWLMEECYDIGNNNWLYQETDEVYSSKEVLEIYKKEKGL